MTYRLLYILLILKVGIEYLNLPILSKEITPFERFIFGHPPIIYKVWHVPKYPLSTDSIKIFAAVENDVEKTDDRTERVFLHYSIDNGKKWYVQEFEKMTEKFKHSCNEGHIQRKTPKMIREVTMWITEIPPQKEAEEIIYYISALDTSGNYTTEIIKTTSDTKSESHYVTIPDFDDPIEQVVDELDILGKEIYYDDFYIYLRMKCQGNITDEISNPIRTTAYGVLILNPDYKFPSQRKYFLSYFGSHVLVYSPLNKVFNSPKLSFYEIQSYRKGSLKYAFPEYKIENNILSMKFQKFALGSNPSNELKLVFITASAEDKQNPFYSLKIADAGPWIRIYFNHHLIKIIKKNTE